MNDFIETCLMLIRHEMLAEHLNTVNRNYIEQIVLRAGGKIEQVETVLNHSKIKKNGDNTFCIKK